MEKAEIWPNEDWTIVSVEEGKISLRSEGSNFYVLGGDHIRNYTSDAARSTPDAPRGHLTLLVQLFIDASGVSAVPAPYPGVSVLPRVDRARKARAFFCS